MRFCSWIIPRCIGWTDARLGTEEALAIPQGFRRSLPSKPKSDDSLHFLIFSLLFVSFRES